MYYKPDWELAKKRIEAFWQNEVIDRCCVAVFAPRKTSKIEPLLAELSPKGLFLCTQASSEEEADNLLRSVARWSASGDISPVA
jgi:hypothetical protein